MRALLALEDGSVFHGRAFGSTRPTGGEVVFNTSMSGYQEILTDPSYHGQIVAFTAPHLGNYGIHSGQDESARMRAAAVITREACVSPSHPGSIMSLPERLKAEDRFGLTEVDTRALTLLLREKGTLRGWLTCEVSLPEEAIGRARTLPQMREVEAVPAVSSPTTYQWTGEEEMPMGPSPEAVLPPDKLRVAVLDCGVKYNILRELHTRGCAVAVVPWDTEPERLQALAPDGIVLSNGPGDPRALEAWLPNVSRLIERSPTLAICLGHQLCGIIFGAQVIQLPFGHHGANHPVKDLNTGRVHITAQNHNYAVDHLPTELELTHRNLNDGTVEGFRHKSLPLWSVQFHPEASPGPHDAVEVFDRFVEAIAERKHQSAMHERKD